MKAQLIAIANRKDYDAALALLDALMDSTRAEDVARARAQAAIIAAWEAQISPIRSVHPVDAIKFRMDQMGMTEKDLARILGSAGASFRARIAGKRGGRTWRRRDIWGSGSLNRAGSTSATIPCARFSNSCPTR